MIAGTAMIVLDRIARRHDQKVADEARAVDSGAAVPTAFSKDLAGSLQGLVELQASGALSAQEYAAAKAKLLAV